jgi:hypothetical protein
MKRTPPRAFSAASLLSASSRALILSLFGALALIGSGPAGAHVAASVDDNNRYLKLTFLGDRVRLAYTVFFGEVPGRQMRPGIDRNRDGQLDPEETDVLAARLATEVAGQLALSIDGKSVAVRFAQRSFGTMTRSIQGGAFSVDLIATICMAPAPRHQLALRDRFAVPRPGETEVRLEDGPGIRVLNATIGDASISEALFRFAGAVPALGEPGLRVEVAMAPDAPGMRGGTCAAEAGEGGRAGGTSGAVRWALPLAIALLALVGLWSWGRRKRSE